MLRKTLVLLMAFALVIPAWTQQRPKDKASTEKAMNLKIIDGPRVEGVGANWAMIAWTTNTGGSSIVRYGTDPKSMNETAESPYADNEKTSSQTHRVHLKNLKPGTTYYFVADSGQGEGTGTESKSSQGQFTTKTH